MQLLVSMLVLPLIGAGVIAVAPQRLARLIGLATSLAVFVISVLFAVQFPDWKTGGFWPTEDVAPTALGISLTLAVDSVSLLLILLTTFLTPLALLGSWTAITVRQREFYGWFLALLSAMLLAFMARDAIVFYVGYEFTIVPMLFLIAVFGGDDRRNAAVKFFIYTFVASVFTLAGLIYVAAMRADATGEWTFALPALQEFARTGLTDTQRFWTFVALMIGFAVKVPLFPVHTWLPLAHEQAPTGGSVILAGTLLKLGTYGIYRVALPMAPGPMADSVGFLAGLSVIAIVAISLVCLAQRDAKRLVAYSSVSHMGVAILGMVALNPVGVSGSVLYWINHGLATGALFLCIGMMYERYHTKDMDRLGGLAKKMPIWAFFMVFFTMCSIGLPGLNGFVSEVMCLFGAFTATPNATTGWPGLIGPRWMIVAGVGSLIFGAAYMLLLVGKIVWGPLKEPIDHAHGGPGHDHGEVGGAKPLPADLNVREISTLAPIALVCLFLGLQPAYVLDAIEPSVRNTIAFAPDAVREKLARDAAAAETTASADASGMPLDAAAAPTALLTP
jgi:NADH-quinone oxidoreductase subunit M